MSGEAFIFSELLKYCYSLSCNLIFFLSSFTKNFLSFFTRVTWVSDICFTKIRRIFELKKLFLKNFQKFLLGFNFTLLFGFSNPLKLFNTRGTYRLFSFFTRHDNPLMLSILTRLAATHSAKCVHYSTDFQSFYSLSISILLLFSLSSIR
jgi:hypothetical protein